MMAMGTLVGRGLHRKIKLMRVDLQTQHRFHVFPRLIDVGGTVAPKTP